MVENSPIKFWLSQPYAVAGQKLEGAVSVSDASYNDTLTIYLRCVSSNDYYQRCKYKDHRFLLKDRCQSTLVELPLPITDLRQGDGSYRFCFNLPEDLPQSAFHQNKKICGLKSGLTYSLTAELRNEDVLRHSATHEFQVYRPNLSDKFNSVKFTHENKVGGFFNFDKQDMKAQFQIDTSSFVPGQTTTIRIS
jgi:hypothetical protein